MGFIDKIIPMEYIENGIVYKSSTDYNDAVADNFSVTTWNCNKQNQTDMFIQHLSLLLQGIGGIFSLQEIEFLSEFDLLCRDNKFNFCFAPNFQYKGVPRGIATLSPSIVNSYKSIHSLYREPFLTTPKVILQTSYYNSNGKKLTVINIHGINFVSEKKFSHQLDQVGQLLTDQDGATVILGDFNCWSHGRVSKIDTLLNSLPNEYKEVEFTLAKRAPKILHTFLGAHNLDRIYYSSKYLQLVEGSEEVVSSYKGTVIDSSDHAPLTCKFTFL